MSYPIDPDSPNIEGKPLSQRSLEPDADPIVSNNISGDAAGNVLGDDLEMDDDPEFDQSMPVFHAHWHLFLPGISIAVLYLVGWLLLYILDMHHTTLARLFVVVLAIGVPVMVAHAFLRFQTIRIQALADAVRYHPGWPMELPRDLPAALIDSARVRRGLSGRLFGGGTVQLTLTTGQKVSVADLKNPEGAKAMIDAMLERKGYLER